MKSLEQLKKELVKDFPGSQPVGIKAHGRLEIVGNHTDHNHGLCLVSATSLGILGALIKTTDKTITINSVGFDPFKVSISDLHIKENEKGTSAGIVRGVVKGFLDRKFKVGGFALYCDSDIFPGAGVSSSACFESLICEALNYLYNDNKVSPLDMAVISQFSEREYFGKPCGMLDQVGACYGGICYLDFGYKDPIIKPLSFTLPLSIIIVNTGGNHANLTPFYASIPEDMKSVARLFGKEFLRDVKYGDYARLHTAALKGVTQRADLRAQHFFDENIRVQTAVTSILSNQTNRFLDQVRNSQISSENLLNNTMVPGQYEGSPQQGIDIAETIIKNGAVRIMGGGFAGSIIAFVYPDETAYFKQEMSKHYGENNVVEVSIPNEGPTIID